MTCESQDEALARIKRDSHERRERYIEVLRERDLNNPYKYGAKDDPFFSTDDLHQCGFTTIGTNVKISRKCSLYAIRGSLGDHVRIDDYCTLKGQVVIGSYVHIAAYVMISGALAPITLKSFSSIAARSTLFSGSDDHRANTLSNPQPPQRFVTTIKGPITVGLASMVGAHCVVLPNVIIGDGASIGSGCVVYRDVPDGGVLRMPAAVLQPQRRDHAAIVRLATHVLREGN